MKKSMFSLIGLILGVASLALIVLGKDIAKGIYPDPPPPPLLTRRDMTPLGEGEIKDAVVDFAADVTAESSRKIATATAETGKKTARRIWDTVKGWTEDDAETVGENPDEKPSDEAAPAGASGDDRDAERIVAEQAGTGVEEAETVNAGGLRWRDVKINLINPGSPDQKRLVGIFDKATLLGGLAALVMAMTGWIRRENQRICICAGIVGILAMAWAYVMAAIAVIIVGVILGPFINS